jgi:putative DNA primase/helicase
MATGSAANMASFPLLPGVEALTLLADNDEPDARGRRAGQDAAQLCKARWEAAKREVTTLMPNIPNSDFNDVVLT